MFGWVQALGTVAIIWACQHYGQSPLVHVTAVGFWNVYWALVVVAQTLSRVSEDITETAWRDYQRARLEGLNEQFDANEGVKYADPAWDAVRDDEVRDASSVAQPQPRRSHDASRPRK